MKNTLMKCLSILMIVFVVPVLNFFEKLSARVTWSMIGLFGLVCVACAPANATSASELQSGVGLIEFIKMVWMLKSELPWYQLMALTAFAAVPFASIFVSITPTPKDGTLWSWVYKYIEATALNFWKAKDKEIDTAVRKAIGKPLNAKTDGITLIGNELRGIAIQKAKDSVLKKLTPKFLRGLF